MFNSINEAVATYWLRLMADERRAWRILTVAVAVLAVFKGLRFPNLWSATQLQFGYQFGFIKRGGAGALLQLSKLPIHHYWVFAAFSFVILGAVICLCALFIRRYAVTQEAIELTPVFVSSFAVTYLVFLVGYLDLILIAMTLLTLTVPPARWPRALDYVVCVSALLIHEEFAITFFPVIWLSRLLCAIQPTIPAQAVRSGARPAAIHAIALPIVVAIGTVIIALPRPLSVEQMLRAHAVLGGIVDFPLRNDFFEVMQQSFADNVRIMIGKFHTIGWWFDELQATCSLLWIAVLFAWRAVYLVPTVSFPQKVLLIASILGTCFAPVLMQLMGWDISRWYAIAAFTSFAAYLLVAHAYDSGRDLKRLPHFKRLVLVLIGLNLSTGGGLFDEYKVNTFPYVDVLRGLLRDFNNLGYVPIPSN